jgi:prepilin-type N-terminal cleavage/methylation domain-containing protein
MIRGLTLLEVLAAVSILGMVVVAVTPLTLRLGQSEMLQQEQQEARRWLYRYQVMGIQQQDLVRSIKDHPGWYLHQRSLVCMTGKRINDTIILPERQWLELSIRTGSASNDAILCDRLILVRRGVSTSAAAEQVTP